MTGGAGFIGSNYVLRLLASNDDIRVINVDALTYAGNLNNLASVMDDPRHHFVHARIEDAAAMRAIFDGFDVDYVVNFAAESHVDRSIAAPEVFVATNVLGTERLLSCARQAWETESGQYRDGVRFLQVSTDEVYGSLGPEGYFTEDTPLDPHSPYSASKAAADLFVQAYGDTYGLPVSITRCSNNYGPYQFPEKLIPLMFNNACQMQPLPVYGDGLNVRDWLFVEDHCAAIDLVLAKGRPGEVYNIGGHNERTNIDIVKKIIEFAACEVDAAISADLIRHVTDRKGHDRRYAIDPAKISRELGWAPKVSFDEGIVMTLRWYRDNPAWIRDVTSGAYRDYYERMYGRH